MFKDEMWLIQNKSKIEVITKCDIDTCNVKYKHLKVYAKIKRKLGKWCNQNPKRNQNFKIKKEYKLFHKN